MKYSKIENISGLCLFIGNKYLVKCVRIIRRNGDFKTGKFVWIPVMGELHHDKELYLQEKHYHIDWRFMTDKMLNDQQNSYNKLFQKDIPNSFFFAPVMQRDILEERYILMIYKRNFPKFPEHSFDELIPMYENVVMKDRICPHKKANLTSCKVINNVITCPLHGLKWDANTGKMIK